MPDTKHQFIDLCSPNCETTMIADVFLNLKSQLKLRQCEPFDFIRTDVYSKAPPQDNKTILLLTGNENHRNCNHFQKENTVAIFQAYPPLPKPWTAINQDGKWVIPTLTKRERWFYLPLGCTSAFVPIETKDRDIDLFFSGQLNPQRINALYGLNKIHTHIPDLKALVHGYQGFAFSGNTVNVLTPTAYARFMGKSKIALCLGGKSPETFRHYEAAQSGCIVLSSPLPDIPMYTEAPFLTVNKWNADHIATRIKPLIDDSQLVRELSIAHREWYNKWAAAPAIATHIINSLESNGAIR